MKDAISNIEASYDDEALTLIAGCGPLSLRAWFVLQARRPQSLSLSS
mgnify:FL=1